jgi:2-haloacid dehalogenase
LEAVRPLSCPAEEAARFVIEGMSELDLHPDVTPAVRALAEAGWRIVTLSQGASTVAERLLERAGLADLVEQCLSVSAVQRWKPHPAAYRYAAERCNAEPQELVLISVHPWDVDGAARSGLRTGWLARSGERYPPYFREPDIDASGFGELAAMLAV